MSFCAESIAEEHRSGLSASVLGLFPNKTWKGAITGENDETILDLHAIHLPMTVFVAAEGLAANVEQDNELLARIIGFAGRSSLVEYWRPEEVKG